MWSSIQHIIKPDSFSEALQLQKNSSSTLLAGGSYLVSEKDLNIQTLISISHLLPDTVEKIEGGLQIGAGITLQHLLTKTGKALAKAITSSCPSKNIRNQRTLGGEIARDRPDSDLMVYLYAADAQLQINELDSFVHISKWDRQGIISNVFIPIGLTMIQRVSVLDSAPAFVIAAVHETSNYFAMAVGGKSERICYCRTTNPPKETDIRHFLDEVEAIFGTDHFGSPDYKRKLVSKLLHEMTAKS